ncbi:MAG: hypothetical protein E7345_01515 [Clostridiales bacterium]|nr:hypothetical protein [Clostridiales bacterium]
MKVIDFIEKFTGTIDVYDNYVEELSIAYCGEKLTEVGKEHFAKALQLPIDHFDTEILVIAVDEKGLSENEVEERLALAKDLFESIAGGCSASDWDKWFSEE